MGQLRRPVETRGGGACCAGRRGRAQRACRCDQRERVVARIAGCTRRRDESGAGAGVDRAAPAQWMMCSQPRHGRRTSRRRCGALAVRSRRRGNGCRRYAGRCRRTKRRRTTRDGARGLRCFGGSRDRRGHLARRWCARRRKRCNRGDPHRAGRRCHVIRDADGRLTRVCRAGPRGRFMHGDQPADDAERADAPADRVPRASVANAAADTGGVQARSGGQCNRRPRMSRCRRGDGQRLPVACAVRPVDVDAERRQCRDPALVGSRTAGVAKDPVAAERRYVIERPGAWAGEGAFDGDEER